MSEIKQIIESAEKLAELRKEAREKARAAAESVKQIRQTQRDESARRVQQSP